MNLSIATIGLEELAEGLVRDFLQGGEAKYVDIEKFITEYLGLTIKYEALAEEDQGIIGFMGDGKTAIRVYQRGVPVLKVYPVGTIVIEQYLLRVGESGRRRFTLAHEAGHFLLSRMNRPKKAENCQEQALNHNFSSKEPMQKFDMTEANADQLASCLLMPKVLVNQALEVWNDGKPLLVYGETVIPYDTRMKLRGMAYRLGVSQSALFLRLRKLGLIEQKEVMEYIRNDLQIGRCSE